MTTEAIAPGAGEAPASVMRRLAEGRTLPVLAVILAIMALWYLVAIWLNAPQVIDRLNAAGQPWGTVDLVHATWSMERPVLPAPDQVAREFYTTVFEHKVTSKRSLLLHAGITVSATLLGFVLGSLLGIALAVGIVHARTLDRSLLPWIIASQTIPILAIAPMIIVGLGNIGITGLVPKAIISAYLSFFPVTIGMVKGFRSPDLLQLDLMHGYSASESQLFRKLRWPASLPFLFTSLKVAVAISLVGAIVGELPTGATAGLGARLLTGSYYGQTVQIWSALLMASLLGMALVYAVGVVERLIVKRMGAPP